MLEKIEKHRLKVPRGDRSGVVIEPYLTDQWFVATRALAETGDSAPSRTAASIRAEAVGEHYFA